MAGASVPNLTSTGNITKMSFVKFSGTNTGALATAATDNIAGITQDTTRRFDSTYAAIDGDQIPLQNPPDGIYFIVVGSGGVTAGKHVECDSSGHAITALFTAITNRQHSYLALETVTSGVARLMAAKNELYIPSANSGISGGG